MEIPSSRPKRHARIEIIPLIDIMFFLLATFVMVSLSMVKNRGIPVLLPAAESGTPQEHQDPVVISLTDSGQIYLDRTEMELETLTVELRRIKQSNPEVRVFINGDQNARLGMVLAVLDETRKQGITKVAFETRPK